MLALEWNVTGSMADLAGDSLQNVDDLGLLLANLFLAGNSLDGCIR